MAEGASRLMNLQDVANRVEKIIAEAGQNCDRITEAGDILLGIEPTDASNKVGTPAPNALLHRIGQSLGVLENIMNGQRQELHRLHSGLREAPPKTLGQNIHSQAQSGGGPARY